FDVVDYGAYELSEPEDVEFFNNTGGAYSNYSAGDFTFTMNEGGVASINMIRMVRLGFKPYTVEIVPDVSIYDTNPLNSCNGQPYLYDPVSYILTYCPPADFHNEGISDPLAGISFDYRVTGLFDTGTIGFATVTVAVDAVDDGNVLAGTQKHATDLVTTIAIPLRPRFDIDPFTLNDASGNDNKDYPFVFSGFAIDNGAVGHTPSLVTNINFGTDVVDGVFTYTAPSGALQGAFEFTYTATDQDGDFATRRVRVRVVDRILAQGMNDNTSLGVVYTGTWTPQFNATAYLSSLHSTTQIGARAQFNFVGDSIRIGYLGNPSAGNINITADATGSAVFTSITAIAGITCTPASNPFAPTANIRGYIDCKGFESVAGASGEVHTVRIDNNSANGFRLDWILVDSPPLTIGTYEDTALRPYLSNTTLTTNV
ncbi:MAG TPA: hypothetical protein PLZ51_17015, partial [Aggregatilineales bacterium]|nr:hypothetical protein [Aggregatilineales bacterium]